VDILCVIMSGDLLKRLETVTARLEAYASSLPAAGAKKAESKGAGGDSAGVAAYDAYYSATVQPFIDTCRKIKETTQIGDWVEKAFKHQRTVLQAAAACKKPSPDAFMAFVGPISSVMQEAEAKVDNRSAWFPWQKAFAEGVVALGWVAQSGAAKPVIIGGLEAADYHLIKILTAAKNKSGDEQATYRAYAQGWKDVLTQLGDLAQDFYKLGLDWNPKGGDLSSFSGSGGSSSAPAEESSEEFGGAPPPPGPPPSLEELTGGAPAPKPTEGKGDASAALFASINVGGNITSGLKKVTKDMMTHKNKALREQPGLAPKEKKAASGGKKFGAATEEKKPARTFLDKGTWFVEFYDGGEVNITIEETKQAVYVSKCKNLTVNVPEKCKSIAVDGCFKTRVVFKGVVSGIEIFNSQRCAAEIGAQCPSVAIDKSLGCRVELSREAYKSPPQLITSNISECNLQVPGAKEEDDPIELPVPEQYETRLLPGNKLETKPTAHGD